MLRPSHAGGGLTGPAGGAMVRHLQALHRPFHARHPVSRHRSGRRLRSGRSRSAGTRWPMSPASCSAGGMRARLVTNERLWGGRQPPMTPPDIDDFLVWVALGIVARRTPRLCALLQSGHLSSTDPLGHLAGLARRHVLPWRLARHHHRDDPVRARAAAIPIWSLFDVVRRGRCRSACSSAASPTSSTASSGAGRPMCPGPWSFPNGGPLPRHPSQLYEAALEGLVLFLSCCASLTHAFGSLQTAGPRRRRLRRRLWRWRASSSNSSASPTRSSAILAGLARPWACCCRCRWCWSASALIAGRAAAANRRRSDDAARREARRLHHRGERPDHRRRLHGALPRRSASTAIT